MLTAGSILHRRVSNRPCQRWAVGEHLVEEVFTTPNTQSNDPQETTLNVGHASMEVQQHLGDACDGLLGENRVVIVADRTKGMVLGQGCPPVQHFFPVRNVGRRCGLDQKARVPSLSVALRAHVLGLLLGAGGKELAEHSIRLVEKGFAQIVSGEDKAVL